MDPNHTIYIDAYRGITTTSSGDKSMSKKCGILPSYTIDAQNKCKKYTECTMTDRTKDPKCPAKGQK
jgi:hypothetical protein